MNNKSIQILRTKLNNVDTKIADEVLLDGQPFYNKTSSITVNGSKASWIGQKGDRTSLYGEWKLDYFVHSPTNSTTVSMVYHRDYYNDGDTIISDDPTRNIYKADDRFTIEIQLISPCIYLRT